MLIFISGENRQKKKNMYRKKSKGWYKHKDFILIDLICIILSFLLADWVRNSTIKNLYQNEIYRNTAIFLVLMDLCVCVIFESYKGVLRRGYYLEFNAVIKQTIILELGAGLYLFSIDGGHFFSRIVLYLMGAFYIGLAYLTRLFWKKHLKIKMAEGGEHSLYIITTTDIASDVIASVLENNYNRYNINGLVLTDRKKAKEISAVVLDGKKIGFYSVFPVEGKLPEELKLCETEELLRNYPYGIRIAERSGERREEETILDLLPKNLVLGIGCRKGISEEEIQSAVNEVKKILGFTEKEVSEIDSIDLKKEEAGLLSYAAKWKLPFYTFSAEELGKVKCVSSHSEFVRKVTGVDNVCERAAILAAGEDGRLLMPKQCMNRVTIAVAEKKVRIRI